MNGADKQLTLEQARLALINATDSFGQGSQQFRAALRAYNRAKAAAAR